MKRFLLVAGLVATALWMGAVIILAAAAVSGTNDVRDLGRQNACRNEIIARVIVAAVNGNDDETLRLAGFLADPETCPLGGSPRPPI